VLGVDSSNISKAQHWQQQHNADASSIKEVAWMSTVSICIIVSREWESPRIVSSSATLNSTGDMDTMEIPQGEYICKKIIYC